MRSVEGILLAMILQEDTSRQPGSLAEGVKVGSYTPGTKEYAWDINDSTLPKVRIPHLASTTAHYTK